MVRRSVPASSRCVAHVANQVRARLTYECRPLLAASVQSATRLVADGLLVIAMHA
jgi:hypothetical protein